MSQHGVYVNEAFEEDSWRETAVPRKYSLSQRDNGYTGDLGIKSPYNEENWHRIGTYYPEDSESGRKVSTASHQEGQDTGREQWGSPVEFILSCIALSVGLGNVWRFPATALANGGGAFLIPYLCVLTFIGRPLYYMELCLGQFASFGCVKVWNMVPAMKGIGYGQTLATACVLSYYVALMAFTMFYFFASFSSELPWSKCPENSTNCFDSSTNTSIVNVTDALSAAERYYRYEVAQIHENGLDDGVFGPEWRLTLCLLGSWIIIFFILAKGVQSSGKAAYFTALFPYLVLFTLLIRGAMLPGATKGMLYFVTPHWEKLLEPEVWKNAVGQCFFSLSVSFGSIIMMSSYNNFRHNVYRDALIIAVTDTLTSILAGCITFAIMGYLAEEMGLEDLQHVIKDGGTGLAFVSYPDVLAKFSWCPQLFSVLFFLMLFTLGTGSATGLASGIITVVCDNCPNYSKLVVTLVLCIIGFLVGIVYMTPQGQYLITLVDTFAGDTAIYILAICEIVAVQYIYGFRRFLNDIDFMLGMKMGIYWKFCWVFLTPVALSVILIYSFVKMGPLTKGDYVFGGAALGCSIGLAVVILSLVPIYAIIQWKKFMDSNSMQRWWSIFQPSTKWGPMQLTLRKEYDLWVRLSGKPNPSASMVSTIYK